jgi:PAS domain S-box-containing protein
MKDSDIFKEIFHKSPIGIFLYDENGKIFDANQSALEILGIPKLENILGTNLFKNPYIAQNKEILMSEKSIKFQAELNLKYFIDDDISDSKGYDKVFIYCNVSVIESGFLVEMQNITEQKRATDLIRKNEYRYHSFFEDDLTGDFIATPEGKVIECNPSFVEIYSLKNSQKVFKPDISKFNRQDWNNLIIQLKIDRKIKAHQSKHIRPDGIEIHVVSNIVGIFNDADELIQVKGYIFDDTERKKAEEFLQESKEKYHRLFDEDLTGDFIATLDGEILECNPAFADIYGFYSREKAAQCNISKFNSFDWPYMVTRLKKERKLQGFQSWQRRSDGMRIHVVANLVGIFNDADELIQVKGYIFDDTERKKAEEELSRSKRQMTEILDSIQDGFVALSQYWHFVYVNQCAAEYFGFEYDDIIGQNLWETFPELVGTIYESNFRKAMEEHEIQHFEAPGMLNSDRWFDYSIYRSVDGISVYWRDITKRKN